MNKLTEVEKLLIDLIDRESITGNEATVAGFIESKLSGFRMSRQYISRERFNVVAQKGNSDVWIVAHMDTVPPFFSAKVTKDKIFGRGSIDNKGNIAGAIMAARRLSDINLLFTVGEEKDSIGARKANIKGRAIVMEPTNFKVRTAQCGVVAARITAEGGEKHSSLLAEKNESAIYTLINALHELSKKNWHCFNVGIIKGGVAPNVVAGSAEAEFSVRPKNRKEFENILSTFKTLKNVKVGIIQKALPFKSHISKGRLLSEPVSFFSELPCFKEGVLFGVGDIAQAHTVKEFVLRKDLTMLPDKLIEVVTLIKK